MFDPKGRYLYFVSNRDFNLTFSDRDDNRIYTGSSRVYAGLFNADVPALHRPKNDEVKINGEENGEGEEEAPSYAWQPEGFESRVTAVNSASGNYGSLAANDSAVFYISQSNGGSKLLTFNLEKEEEKTVLEGVGNYVLAQGGGGSAL